nr:myosin-6-like isoform X1 [Tanacetum cinerariifolium]
VFNKAYSYNDFDSSGFDQPPQYPIDQAPLHDDMSLHEMLIRSTAYLEESTKNQKQSFVEFKIFCDNFWFEMERNKVMNINAQINNPSVDYFDDEDDDDDTMRFWHFLILCGRCKYKSGLHEKNTFNAQNPQMDLQDVSHIIGQTKKVNDTDKRFEEPNKISDKRLKQALDTETQIMRLRMAIH